MPRLIAALAIVLSCLIAGPAAAAPASNPAATVTAFHAALLQAMREGDTLGCKGRVERLTPAIDQAFDLPAIAERSLRRHWSALSETQQARFIAAFREQVIATYASRFKRFNGERFDTLDTRPQPGDLKLVHARLTPGSGDPVAFDYVLRPLGDDWKIVNVIADGVSDLALRSTQYDALMKQRGFDGLMADVQSQTANARRCQ